MRVSYLGIGILTLALATQAPAAPGTRSVHMEGYLQYQGDTKPQIVLFADGGQTIPLESSKASGNLFSLARTQGSDKRVVVSGVRTAHGSLLVDSVRQVKGEQIRDYFPTKKGHTWFFKDLRTNEEFNINVQGNQSIHGVNAWEFQRTRTGMAHDFDLISIEPAGVFLHKRFVRGNTMDLLPAAKFCDAELVPGKVFRTEPAQINPATGNTTVWTAKVEKFESQTVPAGTFPCVKINLVITDKGLGSKLAEVTMWYAKGVGVICRQGQFFGVFLVEKLLRYTLVP